MIDQNKPSALDSLSAEIDNAVEDLFSSYQTPQQSVSVSQPASTQAKPATAPQTPSSASIPPKPASRPQTAQAQPTTKPSTALDDEIDRAVDDLFGAYETPKPAAVKADQPKPHATPVTPQVEIPEPQPDPVTGPNAVKSDPPPAAPIKKPVSAPLQKSSGQPSALADEIDKAVDDLFGSYENPKPPSHELELDLQSAPPLESITQEAAISPPALEIEEISGPSLDESALSSENESTQNLWALLDQALLTVDWEVTSANVRAAKRILDNLLSDLHLSANKQAKPVITYMDEILSAMSSIPESVPTTGPQALQEGLQALKAIHESDPAAKTFINNALNTLRDSLPDKDVLTAPAAPPGTVAHTLHHHLRVLAQCSKNTAHLEKLFAAKPAYQKLLNAEASLRQSFEGETAALKNILKDLTGNNPPSSDEQEVLGFLDTHNNIIRKCISKITTLEKLFSQKPSHHKLLAAHQKIRTLLEKQLQSLSRIDLQSQDIPITEFVEIVEEVTPALDNSGKAQSDSSLFSIEEVVPEPVTSSSPAGPEILLDEVQSFSPTPPDTYSIPAEGADELARIVRTHVTDLEHCKDNLLPIENLFSKPGHEKIRSKLHAIRSEIENQMVTLSRALTGDYKSASDSILGDVLEPKSSHTQTKHACPWKSLTVGEWRGKTVAFIPSEVAYERKARGWAKKNRDKLDFLPVRKLKTHLWTKLGSLFNGEMKFLGETYLKHMQIPMLNHVGPFRITTKPPKKPVLLILFYEGYSGAVFLDSPLQSFPVSSSWAWEPINQHGSILAGHLTVKGKSLPVITISRLELSK